MPPKRKKEEIDNRLRIENFYQRWSIQTTEAERWESFKNRVLNSYSAHIGFQIMETDKEDEFHELIGIHNKKVNSPWKIGGFDQILAHSPTYSYLFSQTDIRKFILGIEVLFWMDSLEPKHKQLFLSGIKDAVVATGVPLVVKEANGEVLFFPAGAKLLDEKLVNDNLDWLRDYPKTYESFKGALLLVNEENKERHVIDNLRLALEMLLKDILGNNKSIENQKAELGKFLKDNKTAPEISNLLWQVLDYYSKYQNNYVKHDNNIQPGEMEFILYLTGTIIRFLATNNIALDITQ